MKKRCLAVLLLSIFLVSCTHQTAQSLLNTDSMPQTEGVDASPTPHEKEESPSSEDLIITDRHVIVVDPSDMALAETVQTAIREAANLTLPIVTDGGRQYYEIVVGDLRCEETQALYADLRSPFLGVAARVDGKLVITGGCDAALDRMTNLVAQTVKELLVEEKIRIPSDYRREEQFGEILTKEVLTSINCDNAERISVKGVEQYRIVTPDGSQGAWYYNHIPFITEFKNRLYVFYNSSPINEEDCGQRLMIATSGDGGKTWSTRVLVDSVAGTSAACVLNGRGCYVQDGTLTFFYQMYEYDASTLRTDANGNPLRPLAENSKGRTIGIFYTQTTDGVHWSTPVNLGYIAGGNSSPEQLSSGAILWAGHSSVATSDGTSITSGWNSVFLTLDPDTKPTPSSYESDFFQLADGSILLFSRTGDDVMLAAVSFDDGKTWSDLHRTEFPDYNARFRFGILPDGRYYYLGNRSAERKELVLMTSTDGLNFDTCYELVTGDYMMMKEGLYKGGVFGYPDVFFDETYMYIAYSLKKESMEILKVKLSEIGIVEK